MRDMNVERHNNLRHRADLIDMELHVGHSRPYIESWDPVQNATFTSWSLLQALADEGLPAPIEDDLK